MQNPLKSWYNVYKITYSVYSYLQFQWEVYPLVCYIPDSTTLWNEKVTRLSSGDKFYWKLNAEKKLTTIGTNLGLPSSCSISKVFGMLPLRNPPLKCKRESILLAALSHQEVIQWVGYCLEYFWGRYKEIEVSYSVS